MDILNGAVTLVTGASRGLGKDIALELAEAGARLACVATRAENAAATVAEMRGWHPGYLAEFLANIYLQRLLMKTITGSRLYVF